MQRLHPGVAAALTSRVGRVSIHPPPPPGHLPPFPGGTAQSSLV